jgi:hypothetical protein
MLTRLIRNIDKVNKVLGVLDSLYNKDLAEKYEVEKYTKFFNTIYVLKINALFVLSKSEHLHEF